MFTQPDTLIQNVYDPQSLNRYMFERGNPYGRVDPSGHLIRAIDFVERVLKPIFQPILDIINDIQSSQTYQSVSKGASDVADAAKLVWDLTPANSAYDVMDYAYEVAAGQLGIPTGEEDLLDEKRENAAFGAADLLIGSINPSSKFGKVVKASGYDIPSYVYTLTGYAFNGDKGYYLKGLYYSFTDIYNTAYDTAKPLFQKFSGKNKVRVGEDAYVSPDKVDSYRRYLKWKEEHPNFGQNNGGE